MPALKPGELLTYQRCNASTGCGPKGCAAPVAFRTTRTGAKMPIDPIPASDGNVALVGNEGAEIAEVMSGDRLDAYEGHLYKTHFATCPDGTAFRSATKARKSPFPGRPTMETAAQRLVEDQIKAHAVWFARDCQSRKLTTSEQVRELFLEQQRRWWADERDRVARRGWIEKVRDLARERLNLEASAA